MAVKTKNTVVEALQSLLQDITMMKTMPDADVAWLIETLETPILAKLREPLEGMMQGAGMGAGGMGAGGMGAGAGGGMPGGPGMALNGGGMQNVQSATSPLRQSPSMPNPDEMRRALNFGT